MKTGKVFVCCILREKFVIDARSHLGSHCDVFGVLAKNDSDAFGVLAILVIKWKTVESQEELG